MKLLCVLAPIHPYSGGPGILGDALQHATRLENECREHHPAEVGAGPQLGNDVGEHYRQDQRLYVRLGGLWRRDGPLPWSGSTTRVSSSRGSVASPEERLPEMERVWVSRCLSPAATCHRMVWCLSLASSLAPEQVNRTTLYGLVVFRIGPQNSRIARDSLAFEVARRRPDTSPIIVLFPGSCGVDRRFFRSSRPLRKGQRKKVE